MVRYTRENELMIGGRKGGTIEMDIRIIHKNKINN